MASPINDEVKSLKASFDEFVGNIESRHRDIYAILATLEEQPPYLLKSILNKVAVLRRLICTGPSSLKQDGSVQKRSMT